MTPIYKEKIWKRGQEKKNTSSASLISHLSLNIPWASLFISGWFGFPAIMIITTKRQKTVWFAVFKLDSWTAFRGTLKGKYGNSKKAAFIKIDGCVTILNIVMITIEMVMMRKCCRTTAQFFECSSTCWEGIIARCKSSFFVIIIIIIIIVINIMTTISSQFEDWSPPWVRRKVNFQAKNNQWVIPNIVFLWKEKEPYKCVPKGRCCWW